MTFELLRVAPPAQFCAEQSGLVGVLTLTKRTNTFTSVKKIRCPVPVVATAIAMWQGGFVMFKTLKVLALPAVALSFALAIPANACGSSQTIVQPAVIEPVSSCATLTQPAVIPVCDPCATMTQSAVILPGTPVVGTDTFSSTSINPGLIDNNLYSSPGGTTTSTMTFPAVIDGGTWSSPRMMTFPAVVPSNYINTTDGVGSGSNVLGNTIGGAAVGALGGAAVGAFDRHHFGRDVGIGAGIGAGAGLLKGLTSPGL